MRSAWLCVSLGLLACCSCSDVHPFSSGPPATGTLAVTQQGAEPSLWRRDRRLDLGDGKTQWQLPAGRYEFLNVTLVRTDANRTSWRLLPAGVSGRNIAIGRDRTTMLEAGTPRRSGTGSTDPGPPQEAPANWISSTNR